MSTIGTFLDPTRLADLARDPHYTPKRAAPEVVDAAIRTAEQAIADSRKSPAERRVDAFRREADRYAESVTRGLPHTESERRNVAMNRLIGLLTGAFLDSTKDLGEALDLLEGVSKKAFVVCGQPDTQEGFERAWFSEEPSLYLEWKELQRRALRCF